MELGEVDHHARQERLTGTLRRLAEASWQMEGNGRVTLPHLHGGRQSQHIVHRGFRQTNGTGNRRADNVRTGFGISAVALDFKAGHAAALTVEGDGGHAQTEILPISTLV